MRLRPTIVRSAAARLAVAGLAAGLWLAAASPAIAAPGDLDPSFGTFGYVEVPELSDLYGLDVEGPYVYALGPGRQGGVYVVRLMRSDGSIDASFGTDGVARIAEKGVAIGLAAAPSGEIYALTDFSATATLTALRADGTVADAFGDGGSLTYQTPTNRPNGPVIDSKGRIALTADKQVHRLLADGSPDPSFTLSGPDVGSQPLTALAPAPGDGLYVGYLHTYAGECCEKAAVSELDSSGAEISSFGENGIAGPLTPVADSYGDNTGGDYLEIAGRPGGGFSLVDNGTTTYSPVALLTRFDAAGSKDPAFAPYVNADGALGRFRPGFEIDVGADDWTVSGNVSYPHVKYMGPTTAVSLISPEGALDPAFGREGTAYAYDGLHQTGLDVVQAQASGDVVGAGSYCTRAYGDSCHGFIARFLGRSDSGPADLDADGRRDSADSCPLRPAVEHRGCPTSKRRISVRRAGRHKLKGGLHSGRERECYIHSKVKIVRLHRGKARTLQRLNSKRDGKWRSKRLPRGRYRAVAPRLFGGEAAFCPKVKGKKVRIRSARTTARR